jgi:3-isopropylmalate/(R)-2-methylmalate dehydratase large subunit
VQGDLAGLDLKNGDVISVDFTRGEVTAEASGRKAAVKPFSDVQLEIYKRGGLLSG